MRSSRKQEGFTLVEVLLALALLTSLLVAMNVFLFSMGEIWGQNRQRRLFDQHVRAVTRRVEDLLREASIASVASRTGVQTLEVRTPDRGTVPLVTFDLPSGDRQLVWPSGPLPDVRCSIDAAEGRGLVLYWQSRWELDFDKAEPRETVLSPLVTRVGYEYFDADFNRWHQDAIPPRRADGKFAVPARLQLEFRHGTFAASTTVNVPRTIPALPVF